jgi:hypothetical protein
MLDVLRFVSIAGLGVATGTLVTVLVAFIPTLMSLEPPLALAIKQSVDPRIDRFNPPATALAGVAGIAIQFFDLTTAQRICTAIGIVGAAGIAITSLGFNMRINRQMAKFQADAPPPEFTALQTRWNRLHAVRTAAAVVGFTGYTLAVLVH